MSASIDMSDTLRRILAGLNWVQETERRSLGIEVGVADSREPVRIWAYDYDLMEGAFVGEDGSIPDLLAQRRERLLQELRDAEARTDEIKRKMEKAGGEG